MNQEIDMKQRTNLDRGIWKPNVISRLNRDWFRFKPSLFITNLLQTKNTPNLGSTKPISGSIQRWPSHQARIRPRQSLIEVQINSNSSSNHAWISSNWKKFSFLVSLQFNWINSSLNVLHISSTWVIANSQERCDNELVGFSRLYIGFDVYSKLITDCVRAFCKKFVTPTVIKRHKFKFKKTFWGPNTFNLKIRM